MKVLKEVPPRERERVAYSRIFLVLKPQNKWRTIIDLGYVNRFIQKKRFCMETIRTDFALLEKEIYCLQ